MSADGTRPPFTATLRSARALSLGGADDTRLTFRVQWLDAWETLRVVAPPGLSVEAVVRAALQTWHAPGPAEGYEVKLRGHPVDDPRAPLAAAGVGDGATLTVASRARRVLR